MKHLLTLSLLLTWLVTSAQDSIQLDPGGWVCPANLRLLTEPPLPTVAPSLSLHKWAKDFPKTTEPSYIYIYPEDLIACGMMTAPCPPDVIEAGQYLYPAQYLEPSDFVISVWGYQEPTKHWRLIPVDDYISYIGAKDWYYLVVSQESGAIVIVVQNHGFWNFTKYRVVIIG